MLKPELPQAQKCVLVCQNTSCLNNGSAKILALFKASNLPENVIVTGSECQGQCSVGTTVRIIPEETWYCRVKDSDVSTIVTQHLQGGKIVTEKLHPRIHLRFSQSDQL
jgi:(2Fe-2S) ferredoxin